MKVHSLLVWLGRWRMEGQSGTINRELRVRCSRAFGTSFSRPRNRTATLPVSTSVTWTLFLRLRREDEGWFRPLLDEVKNDSLSEV